MDSIEVAHTWLDNAFVFHETGDHHKVLYCCSEVLAIFELKYSGMETNYNYGIPFGRCFGLKAITHDAINESDAAIEAFQRSIDTFNLVFKDMKPETFKSEQRDDYMFFISIEVRKAKLHDKLGQDSKAMRYYTSKRHIKWMICFPLFYG